MLNNLRSLNQLETRHFIFNHVLLNLMVGLTIFFFLLTRHFKNRADYEIHTGNTTALYLVTVDKANRAIAVSIISFFIKKIKLVRF